jgi:modulator of FtsH protease HflC
VRRTIIFAVTIVFALALLARAVTYTVRFTEAAVLTTFGKSAAQSGKSIDPGLHFKWPDPIQSVTKYDTRKRFVQARSETQQTKDSRQLIVEGYCTWKVSDPLEFFKRFSNAGNLARDHFDKAETVIRDNLRSTLGETSNYGMDELFTAGNRPSKLPELEQRVLAALKAGNLGAYGIQIEEVGINRLRLPEEVTKAVMESMRSDRNRLVQTLKSRGDSQAQTITTAAEANASRIEKFAEAYAEEIRRQGEVEATRYVAQMNEAPELAIFLKQVDLMKTALAKRMTFVFTTDQPGFEGMNPSAMSSERTNGVPAVKNLTQVGNGKSPAAPRPEERSPGTPRIQQTGGESIAGGNTGGNP